MTNFGGAILICIRWHENIREPADFCFELHDAQSVNHVNSNCSIIHNPIYYQKTNLHHFPPKVYIYIHICTRWAPTSYKLSDFTPINGRKSTGFPGVYNTLLL